MALLEFVYPLLDREFVTNRRDESVVATVLIPDVRATARPFRPVLRYLRRNKGLAIGLIVLLLLIAFTVGGFLAVNPKHAYPLSAGVETPAELAISARHRLLWPRPARGHGRRHVADGRHRRACRRYRHAHRGRARFISAYFGGWLDIAIRSVCQVLTPIPVLLLQVVIAGSLDSAT